MSCKLRHGEEARMAEAMIWRRTAAPSAAPSSLQPRGAADPEEAAKEQLARQMQSEIERREAEAFARGKREGEAAASKRASQEIAQIQARMAQTASELIRVRLEMRRRCEEDLVHLAIAVARRILHRELNVDPEALRGIVKAALDRIEVREVIRIRLHPSDAGAVRQQLPADGLPGRIEVAADPTLERGAILIETLRGEVDASIDTQLREIDRGFTDLVRRQS